MSFFWRWGNSKEPFPSFAKPENYDRVKVFPSRKDPTKAMDATTQKRWIRETFKLNGLTDTNVNSNRKMGAQIASAAGASVEDLRRHGRWNQDAFHSTSSAPPALLSLVKFFSFDYSNYLPNLSEAYLYSLPRPAMRALAGFRPNDNHFLWWARATVEPPESLKEQVWPEASYWLRRYRDESDDGIERQRVGDIFFVLVSLHMLI